MKKPLAKGACALVGWGIMRQSSENQRSGSRRSLELLRRRFPGAADVKQDRQVIIRADTDQMPPAGFSIPFRFPTLKTPSHRLRIETVNFLCFGAQDISAIGVPPQMRIRILHEVKCPDVSVMLRCIFHFRVSFLFE
jgi:hypothetical protein